MLGREGSGGAATADLKIRRESFHIGYESGRSTLPLCSRDFWRSPLPGVAASSGRFNLAASHLRLPFMQKPVTIAISIGDFNGIGCEVALKALETFESRRDELRFIFYGGMHFVSFYRDRMESFPFSLELVGSCSQARSFISVVDPEGLARDITPGHPGVGSGTHALKALDAAIGDLAGGNVDALVTAPLAKHVIRPIATTFAGHSEYLTRALGAADHLMLMVSGSLRLGLVTGHVSLAQAAGMISTERVRRKMDLLINSLDQDFGIQNPKIAVLGLNPHAGEGGLFGSEDQQVLVPVVEEYRSRGMRVSGPFAADGFFGLGQFGEFDACLAMYHDQGLIAFKILSAGEGINFTAGLPAIRTSPAHGTAFGIAGQGIADARSMTAAIELAAQLSATRRAKSLAEPPRPD